VNHAPRDESIAPTGTAFGSSINDLLRPLMEREIDRKVTHEVDRMLKSKRTSLNEANSKMQAQMQAKLTGVNQCLRETKEQLTKFRAVALPISLMRCNNCGEDLSAGEHMHVANGCGAVSQHKSTHHFHTDFSQIVALRKLRRQRDARVRRSRRRRMASHSSHLRCRLCPQGLRRLHQHWGREPT
jgi:hypothetical protein